MRPRLDPRPARTLRGPDSLRWQLAVWLALALGLVLALFTLAVYALLARSLSEQVDDLLANRAAQVERAIRRDSPFSARYPLEAELPNTFASADVFVQVADVDGEVLGRSENLEALDGYLPVTAEDLEALRAGERPYRDAPIGGQIMRMYSAELPLPEHPVSIVTVARSLEPVRQALDQLRVLAGVGLLFAVGLTALIVWLATGAALSPLERVIQTAEAIGQSSDLSPRVEPPYRGGEVGRLASTFNRMLGRLERSDRELRQANERLEASLRAQRRFTADASHELRTPLTTIRGYAGLLRQFAQVTPEDRVAAVAHIDREAERMGRLVEDLLTLARADGGQPLARERVALAPLLDDVVAQARASSGRRIELAVRSPAEVSGDPDALRQLALILVDNAVKYTPEHGRIEVRLEVQGDDARIAVADTGIGIYPDALPHVFERFYRAHRDRKGTKGTGLGLAIARWIAEEHGGSVEVASALGQGTTFTVHLPQPAEVPSGVEGVVPSRHTLTMP